MSQSDRCLEGAGHLEIPDSLVMVTELDSQYGLIPKTLGNDEEKAVLGCESAVERRSPSDLYSGTHLIIHR